MGSVVITTILHGVVVVLALISEIGLASETDDCKQAPSSGLPVVRVYDASDAEPNYENNGTVVLKIPDVTNINGWPGLECDHTKPVRWVFNIDYSKSGFGDSYSMTKREAEDFNDPSTYIYKAEVELKLETQKHDIVMACVAVGNLCERRVVRAFYRNDLQRYILQLLPRSEETSNANVRELMRATIKRQNWRKYQQNSSCSVRFSWSSHEKHTFTLAFLPLDERDKVSQQILPDRQLTENAYLFFDRLNPQCVTDYCSNNSCQNQFSKVTGTYWPIVLSMYNKDVSSVVYIYHPLVVGQVGSLANLEAKLVSKFWWEAANMEEFLTIDFPVKLYVGEKFKTICHASPYFFSYGTRIGYATNQTSKSVKHKNVTILGAALTEEESTLDQFGRITLGELSIASISNTSGDSIQVTIYCFAPVWNSTKWVNVSRSVSMQVPKLQIVTKNNNRLFEVRRNGTFQKFCNASGDPLPKLTLIKPSNTTTVSISTLEDRERGIVSLKIEIEEIDDTHLGKYKCVAGNVRGEVTESFELRLKRDDREHGPSHLTIILVSVFGAVALIFLVTLVMLVVRYRLEKEEYRRLTEEAVNEFLRGIDPKLLPTNDPTTLDDLLYVNDSVQCLPYNSKFEVSSKNWSFGDTLLGTGAFGLVRKGSVEIGSRKSVVAIKTIKSPDIIDDFKATLLELKIMAHIGHHEHIVRLIAASTDGIRNRDVLIGVEFCANGNLRTYLQKRKRLFNNIVQEGRIQFQERKESPPDEKIRYVNSVITSDISTIDLYKWSFQIASGMNFLATKKVLHADLAARNVLLTENLEAKISDFGLSRELYENSEYTKRTQVALPWKWMAIESLKFLKFSTQSDVWSYGVTLHEVFTLGEDPYPGQTWSEEFVNLVDGGMRLSMPSFCTHNVYNRIMMQCWQKEPSERLVFGDAMSFFEMAVGLLTSTTRNYDECEEFC